MITEIEIENNRTVVQGTKNVNIKCLMCKNLFKVRGRNTKAFSGICSSCMTKLRDDRN